MEKNTTQFNLAGIVENLKIALDSSHAILRLQTAEDEKNDIVDIHIYDEQVFKTMEQSFRAIHEPKIAKCKGFIQTVGTANDERANKSTKLIYELIATEIAVAVFSNKTETAKQFKH